MLRLQASILRRKHLVEEEEEGQGEGQGAGEGGETTPTCPKMRMPLSACVGAGP